MTRLLTWYPPPGYGAPIVLTDRPGGCRVLKGATGLGRAGVQLVTEDPPQTDGTEIRDAYAPARQVFLPVLLAAPDRDAYLARARALARAMPRHTDGQLELAQHDGRRFRLSCRYTSGMGGDEARDAGEDGLWWRFGINLLAADPYWTLADPVARAWTFTASAPTFLASPFLPLRLGSSQVLGDTTLTNDGDVGAPARWTITGPGTGVTLSVPDASTALVGTLTAGQQLIIDTTPRAEQIVLADGTDAWPWLLPGSQLWQIPPGTCLATIAVGGAGTGSRVDLAYTPRTDTPW